MATIYPHPNQLTSPQAIDAFEQAYGVQLHWCAASQRVIAKPAA